MTQHVFYKYRLMIRQNEFNILHRGGRLFQQWCVDMYSKVIHWRINFPKNNQDVIRAELYKGLHDAILDDDVDPSKLGEKIILPASVAYTPRWYGQQFHDASAIIARYE